MKFLQLPDLGKYILKINAETYNSRRRGNTRTMKTTLGGITD